MTKLSVNINKVATLRNTRNTGIPSLSHLARLALEAGAAGITIHPRPDERHIRHDDVEVIATMVRQHGRGAELNIEGNPFLGDYLEHIRRVRPDQCTLVPDSPEAATSDHGWDLRADGERVRPVIEELKRLGARVSLFMDAGTPDLERAKQLGADRIELYTGSYAHDFAAGLGEQSVRAFADTGRDAASAGLGVNAGHDLDRANLGLFLRCVPNVLEVSIGHALIGDALEFGIAETVRKFLGVIASAR